MGFQAKTVALLVFPTVPIKYWPRTVRLSFPLQKQLFSTYLFIRSFFHQSDSSLSTYYVPGTTLVFAGLIVQWRK